MAGLLSGLADFGLDNLEELEIFEEKKAETSKKPQEAEVQRVEEKDLVYDRIFECPVCGKSFPTKVMKTGKAKLLGMDNDLRPKYEGIDAVKYDVELCPVCGYAAISRFFPVLSSGQAKLIRENISQKFHLKAYEGETYTYEYAIQRYTLALANTIVKRGRDSERAYVCLKSAWVRRGYAEELTEKGDEKKANEMKEEEKVCLQNAYNGFISARQKETFPMCGMDEFTIDYLLAELAFSLKKYDESGRFVSSIITSFSANNRIKNKARDLKERIVAATKEK